MNQVNLHLPGIGIIVQAAWPCGVQIRFHDFADNMVLKESAAQGILLKRIGIAEAYQASGQSGTEKR
jgi:hypothetical protein